MASTSDSSAVASRIKTAALAINSDNQTLMAEIRRAVTLHKEIAVDFERENKSNAELEAGVIQMLVACEDCMHFSSAVQSIGNNYQIGEERSDFKKLLNDHIANLKGNSSFVPQSHPLLRQFQEAIWNVHHAGRPMPGEEHEDIVMTSTQCNVLNFNCPLSGKHVDKLENPVRSVSCRHIYDKTAIEQYIRSKHGQARCPMTCCPKTLRIETVVCDHMLRIDIEEACSMDKQTAPLEIIEDFTEVEEE